MDDHAIQSIALIGGGRWSRVLIGVLVELAPNARINWVTSNSFDVACQWCEQQDATNVTVIRSLDRLKTSDAAIVANAPHEHFTTVASLLAMSIPTLCEKPITLETADANELARQAAAQNIPLGVNLLLHCASYLQDFAAQIRGMAIRSLEFVWHDPWVEQRHGERKHAAFHADMTHDMLPHVWSLLRACCGMDVTEVRNVHYSPDSMTIAARQGGIDVNVSLSRRANSRRRQIIVNGGKATLDFAPEPGVTTIEARRIENVWTGRHPLAESLIGFLDVASNPDLVSDWELSIHRCLDSVRFASAATELLHRDMRESLTTILQAGFDIDNRDQLALAVDILGPEYARRGRRISLVDVVDQRDAVLLWLSDPDASAQALL